MPKLLLPLVTVAVVLAGALLLAACETSGEVPATPDATETPQATASPIAAVTPTEPSGGGRGGGEEGTAVPVTPAASPETIPADWLVYTDPSGRFTFRYPATWGDLTKWLGMPSVASWNQETWQQRDYPATAIRVDVVVTPTEGGVAERPPEASDATLSSETGWQFGYAFDPSLGAARNHVIVADHGGYRYMVIGWFADENPDESVFLRIVNSFQFIDDPSELGE